MFLKKISLVSRAKKSFYEKGNKGIKVVVFHHHHITSYHHHIIPLSSFSLLSSLHPFIIISFHSLYIIFLLLLSILLHSFIIISSLPLYNRSIALYQSFLLLSLHYIIIITLLYHITSFNTILHCYHIHILY